MNKEEEDFQSKLEYDDYLEEREDIIFNLVERIQVHEMEAKVARYQQEHGESIARNEARKLQRVLHDNDENPLDVDAEGGEEDVNDVEIHDDYMMELPGHGNTQTREEWKSMALSSGWYPEIQRDKCIHLFESSLHIVAI